VKTSVHHATPPISDSDQTSCLTDGESRRLWSRRFAFAAAVTLIIASLVALMTRTLSPGGIDSLDALMLACFAMTLPWTVVGFWNALVGFTLMRLHPNPVAAVFPLEQGDGEPIRQRVAILSCIRNEDVGVVFRNLDRMVEGLIDLGVADRFAVHVLSDSTCEECVAAEERAMDAFATRWGRMIEVGYRRRTDNPGFKAGNIAELLQRRGDRYDLALVLDADSVLSPGTVLHMVRTMQKNPRLGILQSLVVGLPSTSPFARVFQFGMRFGMRSYTLGSAWWQGDCGPYWGHNALLRIAPFRAHCALPRLPGTGPLSGWVLSHDQVEAVLMRRAGYAVRVLPEEQGSWEENPTTLLEYIRRDLRWCHGNLQYLKLLGMPALHPVGRIQLVLAILMFIGSPFWVLLMVSAAVRAVFPGSEQPIFDPAYGLPLLLLILSMVFAPKIVSVLDTLMDGERRRSFGGGTQLLTGTLAEAVFSTLAAPVIALAHSVFMGALLLGRRLVWGAQRRTVHTVPLGLAIRRLWPQTFVGLAALILALNHGGATLALLSPFFLGALLAAPIAVLTASPALGAWATRIGLWRLPEETTPGRFLARLELPALEIAAGARHQSPDILNRASEWDRPAPAESLRTVEAAAAER
jgi:membrane glycosyltransferase